ncbi:hypothetical protein VTK26DRAFT_6534 [Humicola hyalothermophila]
MNHGGTGLQTRCTRDWMEVPPSLQIRRKQIATPKSNAVSTVTEVDADADARPPLPPRPEVSNGSILRVDIPVRPASRGEERLLQVHQGHPRLRSQTSCPDFSRTGQSTGPSSPDPSVGTAATFGPGISADKRNFMQNALSEARYFAGGLLPHPTESTKHYTILRHSPALVFYRGPSTSVAITIFSSPDRPLPDDRTLWLQQRGFSGDSGMKIKAFFNATDSWLHVTPSAQVSAQQVAPDTERAWQRDMSKAAKKLLKEKGPKKAHVPRETHVVRIPEASEDGYFRILLCTGGGSPYDVENSSRRKILCTSPIFRIASTSTDSSVIRGASFSTLPLEMGVFVASMVASATVDKYIAPVKEPIADVIDRVRPGFVAETIGGLVHDELSDRSAEREAERDMAFYAAHEAHITRSLQADKEAIVPIGPDSGPETPFPLKFRGKVVPGTGRSRAELGIPTANLSDVPDEIQHRLNGIYFGWARVEAPQQDKSNRTYPEPVPRWQEAIITIAPSPYVRPSVTPVPLVAVHLISLPQTTNLLNHTIQAIIMGVLRPAPPPAAFSAPTTPTSLQVRLDAASRDVCLTLVSLDGSTRANWTVEAAEAQLERLKGERGLEERFEGFKDKAAKRILPSRAPSVPLHKIGVRSGAGGDRDRALGVGGYWVKR